LQGDPLAQAGATQRAVCDWLSIEEREGVCKHKHS
jgi:hypothetical protein